MTWGSLPGVHWKCCWTSPSFICEVTGFRRGCEAEDGLPSGEVALRPRLDDCGPAEGASPCLELCSRPVNFCNDCL